MNPTSPNPSLLSGSVWRPLRYLAVLLLAVASMDCRHRPADGVPTPANSVDTIIADMREPHEGRPHGVPLSYGWAHGPRIERGNDARGFKAMIAWGQLYEDAGGHRADNTRVQLRDIKAYVLGRKDGRWTLVQNSRLVEGEAYREDYRGDVNRPADERREPDGSISVVAGEGYNFHFWPATGRVTIDPEDIAGVFTTVQARLVVGDPGKPDDRARARYLLSMGGDYWVDMTARWDNLKTNGGIAIGRFKYVTTRWQAFNMITLSEEEVRRNPPPAS
jgi:hypothetical protein